MSKKNGKKGFITEFKEFITKGNILDMAVGVIIGNSFKAIVTALTDKVIMPLVTAVIGDGGVSDIKTVLSPAKDAVVDAEGNVITEAVAENAIEWGLFIQSIIDFLLVAIVLFVIIKSAMTFQKKREELMKKLRKEEEAVEEAPAAPAEPTIEEKNAEVLKEIRDLLAQNIKK
ncbi:MAG: large conductance mechanosensitive channel protein MscL [Ruminococcaceae bacterium]|nr:large conductance mechanosensitive channel protein MscL [Oscillospiraceae bacterium]